MNNKIYITYTKLRIFKSKIAILYYLFLIYGFELFVII